MFYPQVKKKFPELITLNPQKGERAVLVKDYHGDYAVMVGRWLVLKKHTRETSPSEYSVDLIHHLLLKSKLLR